jgi:hydrogenase nickel incorporation protein HypA/HybF
MHETGIIKNVLDIVEQAAIQSNYRKVTEINLVIGESRAVMPEGLRLGMRVFSEKSEMFLGCKLTLDLREVVLECRQCGHVGHAEYTKSPCPECGSAGQRIIQGNELKISSFSGE